MINKMLELIRTDSENPDFIGLVKLLDADLVARDGKDHQFYSQFNSVSAIKFVVVAFENGMAIGCGAIKEYSDDAMEVKRMFTKPEYRGRGIAARILLELEKWAAEMGRRKCVLETGQRQPEAIALYRHNGYSQIDNYGQYVGVENSVCFQKLLL
jgi:putative acetyltransferase